MQFSWVVVVAMVVPFSKERISESIETLGWVQDGRNRCCHGTNHDHPVWVILFFGKTGLLLIVSYQYNNI